MLLHNFNPVCQKINYQKKKKIKKTRKDLVLRKSQTVNANNVK